MRMEKKQIIFLMAMVFTVGLATDVSEKEEETAAECYPAFDKSFTQEFFKTVQDCQYKPMKKTKTFQVFRSIKNSFKGARVESVKVRTEQECHFLCFTFTFLQGFPVQTCAPNQWLQSRGGRL